MALLDELVPGASMDAVVDAAPCCLRASHEPAATFLRVVTPEDEGWDSPSAAGACALWRPLVSSLAWGLPLALSFFLCLKGMMTVVREQAGMWTGKQVVQVPEGDSMRG